MKRFRTMTWKEIDADWSRMQNRRRLEIAEHIVAFCAGRTPQEVAKLIDKPTAWVKRQLKLVKDVEDLSPMNATQRQIDSILKKLLKTGGDK